MNIIEKCKTNFMDTIDEIEKTKSLYVTNVEKDFSRNRKITFKNLMMFIINSSGASLGKELLDFYDFGAETPSVSAFVQQRSKLSFEAFEYLFHSFTASAPTELKLYKGYRLLACDGSDLSIAKNLDDTDTLIKSNKTASTNHLHLNAFYDLVNRLYIDALIQNGANVNETRACCDMVNRSNLEKVILTADRGYENYNLFAHCEEKNWNYLIRVKDLASGTGIMKSLKLKNIGEFDEDVEITFTRKQDKESKALGYKFMPTCQTFDYLPQKSDETYTLKFRVVRFKISENVYETIITNLDRFEFKAGEIKEMYHLRWGIETSFRELKYSIGVTNFHAKKVDYIKQEVFARLALYNYCEMITTSVVIEEKDTRKKHQVNFTMAIFISREYLRNKKNMNSTDVTILIKKYILPIRPGRKDPRKIKVQSNVSFLYRVA